MTTLESEKLLDDVGWAILRALQDNARISYTDLGKRVSLSPPAVAERVRRLEEAGVIEGYGARVKPSALGLGMTAFVRITTSDEAAHRELKEQLVLAPEVSESHQVTGEDCNIAKIVVRDIEHLETVIRGFARYGRTTTSIVLSTPVGHRVLGPEILTQ
jgi:Lrp/AsnC family leucine-responsive transcriptional regulator